MSANYKGRILNENYKHRNTLKPVNYLDYLSLREGMSNWILFIIIINFWVIRAKQVLLIVSGKVL